MRIALDAMGGDHAPQDMVNGAWDFVQTHGQHHVILVGDQAKIEQALEGRPLGNNLSIVHAPQVIDMGEHPAQAVRRKKDASVVVCANLVRKGEADAMVSAGNTGATMASALLRIGRIPGIDRPAIGSPMPTLQGPSVIVDAGANAECKPVNLQQFAIMGSIYMEKVMGISRPRIGLLSIGEESTKGNDLVLETYGLLEQTPGINFIGNIEGRDILLGAADVVVCDGFVGNIVLKFAEGMGKGLFSLIKRELTRDMKNKLGALLVKDGLKRVAAAVDYTEYGGAPLLGVKGVSIISHGSSNRKAIRNALIAAMEAVDNQVVSTIQANIEDADGE